GKLNENYNSEPENIQNGEQKMALSVLKNVGSVLYRIFTVVINVFLTILLIGMITGVIVGTVFAMYIKNYIDPSIDTSLFVKKGSDTTTRLYYTNYETEEDRINGIGVDVEYQRLYGSENSIWASYDQFPQYLKDAFISIEDHRFESHNGVDWVRTSSAVLGFFFGDGDYGGSTITQQLIKNLTGDDEPTIQRKVEEIFRALDLEKKLDKTEILEMYLNIVFLSNNCTGVQAAANYYFDKDVSELDLVECASLAAIVKNPSKYEPVRHDVVMYTDEETGEEKEDGNRKRRNDVLWTMWQYGKISEAEYLDATSTELQLKVDRDSDSFERDVNSWYTDAVFNDVKDALMEEYGYSDYVASMMIYSGGLHIYTAMDNEIQTLLENIYENDSEYFMYASTAEQPESSMVITDPYTGDVLALVGGRGVKSGNRILNRATQSRRPAGSSIKPISVYGPALDMGVITYGTAIDDSPLYFNGQTPYPKNAPSVYDGMTTIHDAIKTSKNTVAMKVLEMLGIDNSFDFLHDKLQVNSIIESKETSWGTVVTDKALAPLGLGQLSYGLTVQEITNAYSIFVNDGIFSKSRLWTKVTDSTGNIILENPIEQSAVISPQTATIMTDMLEDVVSLGTAAAITLKNPDYDNGYAGVPCAGKTGTTQEDYDRWFIGYTPYYVGGIWFGYDLNQSLSEYWQNPAVLLWDTIMTKLHEKFRQKDRDGTEALRQFNFAPGVISCTYCEDSGLLMGEACYADPRGSRAESGLFTEATKPTTVCDTHKLIKYCKDGGGVAGNDCPKGSVITVGLMDLDRAFDYQIYITDAEYTCKDISVVPSNATNLPYYHTALSGKYSGISSSPKQYNCYCTLHTNFDKLAHPEKYTTKQTTTAKQKETEKPADQTKNTDPPATTAKPEENPPESN
ncbi:MAG: transglycosylase domain-containing protein, partial [Clostridia bacterium]|nr:transglycosylase domain-containing protein [Clostridia bacterium]